MQTPVPITYARAAGYDPAGVRRALETVLAPQFAVAGDLSGKSVLLKPNLLAFKYRRPEPDPTCVHPVFLLEAARLFRARGARVAILENPATRTAEAIVRDMGIAEELAALDVSVGTFRDFRRCEAPERARFRTLELASEYREFDFVADLAKAKTHGMMILTLCVKNLFGLVSGTARIGHHLAVGRDFAEFADLLLDLYLCVKPRFNLLDGIVAMEGNGPGAGTPVACGFVAGGCDALALDASCAARLGVPDLLLLRRAAARGLQFDFSEEGDVPDLAPLALPDPPGALLSWGVPLVGKDFLRRALLARPAVDSARCVGCGLCAKMCPPCALTIENALPSFDLEKCIRCFCCAEHCPKGAITICGSRAMKLLRGAERLLRGRR